MHSRFPSISANSALFRRSLLAAIFIALQDLFTLALSQNIQENRLALVIGNATYKSSPLTNPVNDARLMEQSLKDAGFTVLKAENASRRDMQRLIRDFGDRLKQSGGVGLFYFAGHGVQVRGNNYLIPVDADIKAEDEVAFDSIDAQSVLEKMESAKNRMNLIVLDACRDNPFAKNSRSAAAGLATMSAPSGSLVAYSTAPGSVASDGAGKNGLYTEQLARVLQQPGLPVEEVFKQVRAAVRRASNNQQTPWENTALEGQFYFRAPLPVVVAPAPAPAPQAPPRTTGPDPLQLEMALWDSVKASSVPTEIGAYVARYPSGVFADIARARMAALQAAVAERAAYERSANERAANERAAAEAGLKAASERAAAERVASERAAAERASAEATLKAASERVAAERASSEKSAAERAAADRVIAERTAQQAALQATQQATAKPDPQALEMAFWDNIKVTNRPSELEAYIAQFPSGLFVGLAKARLADAKAVALAVANAQAAAPKPGMAAVSPTTQSADVGGVLGQVVVTEQLTGKKQTIDVVLLEKSAKRVAYSTGDETDGEGRVTSVRMGPYVARLQSGSLWQFPLQVDARGSAVVGFVGQDNQPVRISWRVKGKAGERSTVEVAISYNPNIVSNPSHSRYGTWEAELLDGFAVAVRYKYTTRASQPNILGGPDLFSGDFTKLASK